MKTKYKMTKEHKAKISKALKGRPGHPHSEETKQKIARNISKALKGRKLSKKHRENISKASKGRPGRPHSEETRNKIGETMKRSKSEFAWFNELKKEYADSPETLAWIEEHKPDLLLSNPLNEYIGTKYAGPRCKTIIDDIPRKNKFKFYSKAGFRIIADDLTPEKILEIFESHI